MGSANVFMSKICVWWMKKMAFLWFLIHLKWIIEVSWKKCGYWGKEFSNYTIWGFIFVNTFKLWPFFCIPVSLMELGVLIEDTSCLQRPQPKHQSTESTEWVLAFHEHIAAVRVIYWPASNGQEMNGQLQQISNQLLCTSIHILYMY